MTVSFEAHNPDSFDFETSNQTWFTLCNQSLSRYIQNQSTNDPLNISGDLAWLCAIEVENWSPPEGWEFDKQVFIDFFRTCKGFNIY